MRRHAEIDLETGLAHAHRVAVPALLWVAAIAFAVGTVLWESDTAAPAESAGAAGAAPPASPLAQR